MVNELPSTKDRNFPTSKTYIVPQHVYQGIGPRRCGLKPPSECGKRRRRRDLRRQDEVLELQSGSNRVGVLLQVMDGPAKGKKYGKAAHDVACVISFQSGVSGSEGNRDRRLGT